MKATDRDEKNLGEQAGLMFTPAKPCKCMTCANSHGMPPWANTPFKAHCLAFPREEGMSKPSRVYFDGGDCEFYEPER